MKISLVSALLIIILTGTAMGEVEEGSNLIIEIEGFRNNNGSVLCSLYNAPEGFPIDPNKAIKMVRVEIKNKRCEITILGLEPGEYAFGIIHDENENSKMDLGPFWVPLEGYAASNNAVGFIGPPSYNDAVFTLDVKKQRHVIKVIY